MIKTKFGKALGPLIVMSLLLSTACSNTNPTPSSSTPSPASNGSGSASTAPSASEEVPFTYPMVNGPTLTINLTDVDMEEVPEWAKEKHFWTTSQERTGVKLKAVKGNVGSEDFSLMLASGDLPDLVQGNWIQYPGGPEQAIRQGLLLNLADVFDKYAPNLRAVLDANPKYDTDIKTDEGKYYAFPFFRTEETTSFYGLVIREDKLKKHGLEAPTTVDELYNVLKTFKEDPECEVPITFEYRFLFMGDQGYGTTLHAAYGLKSGFWVEDGKVRHGESDPAYRDFLTTMNKWYAEGLIDPDMPSIDKATALAKFSSGTAWANLLMVNQANDAIDANLEDSDWKMIALKSPVLTKGQKPKFGQAQNIYPGIFTVGISAKSKNVEAAARYMDYMYSDEGLMLTQYGIEGYTYVIKNGEISLDDPSLPPLPEDVKLTQRLGYARRATNWPTIQIGKEYNRHPEVYDMVDVWMDHDALKYILPPVTYTPEESSEYSKLYTDLDTYLRENVVKFIIGVTPMSEFDNFVKGMEQFGLQRSIEIQQAAYDRYLSR